MKLKLFLILWVTFLFSLAGSSLFYQELLKRDRIRGLDAQLESLAGLLRSSEIVGESIVDLKEADTVIQQIIGGNRLGLVIILRNSEGRLLYRSQNALRLKLEPPTDEAWQFIEREENLIRLLTRHEVEKRTILQLGLLVNKSLIIEPLLGGNLFKHIGLVVLGSAFVAWFLTLLLLRPLKNLAIHLNESAKNPQGFTNLPKKLLPPQGFLTRWDELATLTRSLEGFLQHMDSAFKMNMAHSSQLAHEIKTPLSVIQAGIERGASPQEMTQEIARLAAFVDRYLSWGESINRPLNSTEIYALHLDKFIRDLLERYRPVFNNRVQLVSSEDAVVFANGGDLEHVIVNLVQNALKYSKPSQEVLIRIDGDAVLVEDAGHGIPREVLERLGEPFNFGGIGRKGVGLGLSLVYLICRKYGWQFSLESSPQGSVARVKFSEAST